jgi:hypothetical protein
VSALRHNAPVLLANLEVGIQSRPALLRDRLGTLPLFNDVYCDGRCPNTSSSHTSMNNRKEIAPRANPSPIAL